MTESKRNEITWREILYWIHVTILFLKKKIVWLLIAVVIGGVGGYLYAANQKTVYTATLSFALEDDKAGGGGLGGALGLASQFGLDLGGSAGGAFSGSNLIELMKSRLLVERTLLKTVKISAKEQTLAEAYIDNHNWRKKWEADATAKNLYFPINSDRATFTLQQDSVLADMYAELVTNKQLEVLQRDKKISIIELSLKSGNELFAKYFIEALAAEVSDFYIDTKTRKTANNVKILQKQTDSIRSELDVAINGVASATDQTFNLNPALNIKRTNTQKRQVDVQANTAILTELVKNLELAKVTLRRETPLIQVIDSPILPLPQTRSSRKKGIVFGAAILSLIMASSLIAKKGIDKLRKAYNTDNQ